MGSLAQVYGFALVLWRAAAVIFAAPVLSNRVVPVRARVALAMWAALATYLGIGAPAPALPSNFAELAGVTASELLLGMSAAIGATAVINAAFAAGQTAALSLGFGFGALIDPTSGADSSAVGQLLSLMALAAAAAMGIHREALLWLARSLHAVPPGSAISPGPLLAGIATQTFFAAALAVRLAYPMLAAATLGHVVLGLVSRSLPQLNLSNLGFSVAILAGGGALFLTAPAVAQVCAAAAMDAWRAP